MHDAIAAPFHDTGIESAPWPPARPERKAKRKEKRRERQAERARVRENLQAGLYDPEAFLDLESRSKNVRRMLSSGKAERRALLDAQKRKVRSELANTRDLDGFIAKAGRSRTLHSLVALAFFRHVLDSAEYREDHRFKEAIRRALGEEDQWRSIQRRWANFDREFPGAAW